MIVQLCVASNLQSKFQLPNYNNRKRKYKFAQHNNINFSDLPIRHYVAAKVTYEYIRLLHGKIGFLGLE